MNWVVTLLFGSGFHRQVVRPQMLRLGGSHLVQSLPHPSHNDVADAVAMSRHAMAIPVSGPIRFCPDSASSLPLYSAREHIGH